MEKSPAYLDELKAYLRPFTAATIGIAFGLSINNYTSSLFGAQLIHEFGWAKADFAKIAVFAILMVPLLPSVGAPSRMASSMPGSALPAERMRSRPSGYSFFQVM